MKRPASAETVVAIGSVVVFTAIVAGLWWRDAQNRPVSERPLIVLVAPASRLPIEAITADYERETGRRVELRFGASEDILTKVRLPNAAEPADLFIPADDSYIVQAREEGLVAEMRPLAQMRAVLLLAKGNAKGITNWNDLLRDGVKVAVPNPAAAAGKVSRDYLTRTGKWAALQPHVVDTGTVTEAANTTKAGDRPAVDAAIVWDAVAAGPAYRGQTVLAVPELEGATGRIEVAVLKQSRDPAAALAFARYIADPNQGLNHFRAAGYRVADAVSRGEEKK